MTLLEKGNLMGKQRKSGFANKQRNETRQDSAEHAKSKLYKALSLGVLICVSAATGLIVLCFLLLRIFEIFSTPIILLGWVLFVASFAGLASYIPLAIWEKGNKTKEAVALILFAIILLCAVIFLLLSTPSVFIVTSLIEVERGTHGYY